jgi:hypothetical protein
MRVYVVLDSPLETVYVSSTTRQGSTFATTREPFQNPPFSNVAPISPASAFHTSPRLGPNIRSRHCFRFSGPASPGAW